MRSVLVVFLTACLLAVGAPAGAAPEATGSDWTILQGEEAEPGEWPAQVALLDATADDVHFAQFCGGTLISATHVLTAAHCVATTGGLLLQPLEELAVGVGVHDLADPDDGVLVAVAAVYAHPDYDPATSRNDISIVELAEPQSVEPQRLIAADEAELWAAGTVATVVGWGSTDADGTIYPTRLRDGEVPMVDSAECEQDYADTFGGQLPFFPDLMNCAGDPGPDEHSPGPDTCFGDSGGPLLVPHPDGGFAQAGITSFGGPFCGAEVAGAYTRVDPYLDFIAAVQAGEVPPSEVVEGGILDLVPGQVARVEAGLPTESVALAAAVSAFTFPAPGTPFGVLASSEQFPDALAGSSLAFGYAPLLLTPAPGLDPLAAAELQRAVTPGGIVYLLGGEAALSAQVADDVAALGFEVVRLAGATREETAVAVLEEIFGPIPEVRQGSGFGPVILATSANWPDAVAAAQIGASVGYPILLTPPDDLHPATGAALMGLQPERVIAIGGTAAIADDVLEEITAMTGSPVDRISGATRIETAVAVVEETVAIYETFGLLPVPTVTAANLRVDEGFAHHLAASMIPGATLGSPSPSTASRARPSPTWRCSPSARWPRARPAWLSAAPTWSASRR